MRHEIIEINGSTIVVTYHDAASGLLLEAKHKGNPLIGSYSYFQHQRHTPDGDYHLHIYDGDNEIFAINKGGSAHDGYHGVRIPNKVYKELMKRYKNWKFPPDQIVETVNYFYILNSINDLSFSEISNEVAILQSEISLLESFSSIIESKTQPINENVNSKILEYQTNEMQGRIKCLYRELLKRL